MEKLEKILQEIENLKKLYSENGFALMDKGNLPCEYDSSDIESAKVKAISETIEIIKKHITSEESTEKASPLRDNDKWIPCDPENIPDTEVLCCDEYGHIVSGYLSEFKGECICESPVIIMRNVVAWTSKPNPYRKDGE